MSGYSRTDRRCSDTRPKMISSRLITVAKTGRRTDSSEMRMRQLGRRPARLLASAAVADVLRAVDDDALVSAVRRRSRPRRAGACRCHFATLDDVVRDDEHVGSGPARARSPLPAPAASASTSPCSVTVMNMPGRSTPSGFGISARTKIERVTGSTRESRFVTSPLNARPGRPAVEAVTGSPFATRTDRSPAR